MTDWSLRLKNTPQPSVSYVKSGNDKAKRQHAVGTLTCDHNLWGKTCGLQDLQKKRMPSVPCYSTEWHQPFMAPLAPLWERESIFCSDAHSLSPLLHFELKSVCRVECQSLKLKKTNKKNPNAFIHVPFMHCIISINTYGVSLYSFLPLEIFTVCKWHLLDSCCKGCHSSHNHPWAVQSGRWEGSRSRGCSRSSGNSTVSLWCWLEQSPPCQVSLFKTEAKHQSKTKTMKSHKRGSFLQRILTNLWQVKALKIFLQQKVLAQHEHSDADLLALLGVRAMLFVQAGDPVVAQGTAEVAVTWGARPLAAGIDRALCVAVRNTVEMHVFFTFLVKWLYKILMDKHLQLYYHYHIFFKHGIRFPVHDL